MAIAVRLCPQARAGPVLRPRSRAPRTRRPLIVRAHDDDDVLPIFRLPRQEAPESLPKPQLLGGKTIGEELGLIHQQMAQADRDADRNIEKNLYSSNWQGDVYVGSNFNMLTLVVGLSLLIPILGLLFAWATYGSLWGTINYYGY